MQKQNHKAFLGHLKNLHINTDQLLLVYSQPPDKIYDILGLSQKQEFLNSYFSSSKNVASGIIVRDLERLILIPSRTTVNIVANRSLAMGNRPIVNSRLH